MLPNYIPHFFLLTAQIIFYFLGWCNHRAVAFSPCSDKAVEGLRVKSLRTVTWKPAIVYYCSVSLVLKDKKCAVIINFAKRNQEIRETGCEVKNTKDKLLSSGE